MDPIEYQMKIQHHEKSIQILDAIIALEKKNRNQREWLKTPLGLWCNQYKSKHQIEITDMAIDRLNKYYFKHISKLK